MSKNLLDNWDKDKIYDKLNLTKFLGGVYLAVNKSSRINKSILPLQKLIITNGINSTTNYELISKLRSEIKFSDTNSLEQSEQHWIKL